MLKNRLIRFIKKIKGYNKYKTDEEMRLYVKSICDYVADYEFGPVTMNAQSALKELAIFFLGKEWYDNNKSINKEQLNTDIVISIEEQYHYCRKDRYDVNEKIKDISTYQNAQKAVYELSTFFLGKDWYVVDPLTHEQINPIIVIEIEEKYYYCRKDK